MKWVVKVPKSNMWWLKFAGGASLQSLSSLLFLNKALNLRFKYTYTNDASREIHLRLFLQLVGGALCSVSPGSSRISSQVWPKSQSSSSSNEPVFGTRHPQLAASYYISQQECSIPEGNLPEKAPPVACKCRSQGHLGTMALMTIFTLLAVFASILASVHADVSPRHALWC